VPLLCARSTLQTAFNFFAAEQWASMRGELGSNAAPQDISRQIGERWSQATDEERAPYIAKAQGDKVRFDREMDSWRSGLEAAAGASAGADADGAAAAHGDAHGLPGPGESMDLDGGAAAAAAGLVPGLKQEQRSGTPPKPHHPRIKLKMSGRPTPPPAAAGETDAAAGEEAAAAAARSPELPGEEQLQQQHGFEQGLPDAAAAAGVADGCFGGPEAAAGGVPAHGVAAAAEDGDGDGDGMLVDGAEAAAGAVFDAAGAGL
jgi:hypothetical protein